MHYYSLSCFPLFPLVSFLVLDPKFDLPVFTETKICARTLRSVVWLAFFFFFFNGCTHGGIWKFPGQELNLSHSCDLGCSWSNSGSFNHRAVRTCASIATQAAAVGFLTHCATAGTPVVGLLMSASTLLMQVIMWTSTGLSL